MAQNNGDLFDTYGITKMLEAINNNFQQNNSLANNEFAQQMLDKMEKLVGAQDKLTAKDIEKVFKEIFNPFLRGVYGGNTELTNALKILKSEIKELSNKQNVSTKLFSNMLTGGTSLMYSASSSAIRNGSGSKFFNLSNPKDELTAASLAKIFGEQSKTANLLTSIQDKILSFFNENKSQEKTKRRQFIDDLIDGLSKSKWIGGAIMDLFKLASFFAANWLKNFGPIGKALAVGIIAAAPLIGAKMASIISNAIVKGLTNVVKTGLTGLGALFRAAFSEKAIAGLTRGGALAGGALALAGAGALGSYAVNTWNEGGARNKWAGGLMGAGALGLGALGVSGLVAAIAPAIGAAMLAAVAPIAAPVAIIATGAGLVIKFWPQIVNFFKSVLEWLGIIADKDEDGNYVTQGQSISQKIFGYGGQSKRARPKSQKEWDAANSAALQISETGVMLNFGELTQEQLSRKVADFVGVKGSDNYNLFTKNYDLIPADDPHVSFGSFKTDAITNIGGENYIIAPAGTLNRVKQMDQKAKERGQVGSLTQITSGLGTAGNYAQKLLSPHQSPEHFKPTDSAIDTVTHNAAGQDITEWMMTSGIIKSVFGVKGLYHGNADGSDMHLHIGGYASAEGQGNWNAHNQPGVGINIVSSDPIYEAAKQSIRVKEQEIEDLKNKVNELAEGPERSRLLAEKQKATNELIEMRLDKKDIENYLKTNGSIDITGMKNLSNRMKSKPFQDLMGNALIAPNGGN